MAWWLSLGASPQHALVLSQGFWWPVTEKCKAVFEEGAELPAQMVQIAWAMAWARLDHGGELTRPHPQHPVPHTSLFYSFLSLLTPSCLSPAVLGIGRKLQLLCLTTYLQQLLPFNLFHLYGQRRRNSCCWPRPFVRLGPNCVGFYTHPHTEDLLLTFSVKLGPVKT